MRPPTERQQTILQYIRDYTAECGYSPSLRDIAAWFGITPAGVVDQLKALERKGFLLREPGIPRSIRVTKTT